MKKIITLILGMIMCISFSACSDKEEDTIKLTEAQNTVCAEVDEFIKECANEDAEFSREISKKDGKLLYIATLDLEDKWTIEPKLFADVVAPTAEDMLAKENMYVVIYFSEYGEEEYRLIDSRLDPSILD